MTTSTLPLDDCPKCGEPKQVKSKTCYACRFGGRWPDRLWALIEPDYKDCWIWQGIIDKDGYGQIYNPLPRRMARAHRLVWESLVGPIPEDRQLDHRCRVPQCVNPDHLEIVTLRENLARGFGFVGLNVRKTTCPKGHPLSGDNLRITLSNSGGRPARRCVICLLARGREYDKRRYPNRDRTARNAANRARRLAKRTAAA